ncbi:hyaluronidase-1-like [Ornithorhynchus anatinus]|uniref:Hyaluronidase n=1 Tax=Ornithorhynchus anatinus TaxID=9258 RepID=F7G4T3_ORNAN|nr:hyaluronidase-1-like [Ornithorhynchus anatinus]
MCKLMRWLAMMMLCVLVDTQNFKPTKAPMFQNKPFIVFWNAPTSQCKNRHHVDLNLDTFGIAANSDEALNGDKVTIFYHNVFGYYPHISDSGESFHGGVPQNQSLSNHLSQVQKDINRVLPSKDFQGLAIIDWENWRPQWIRNWDNKVIYREHSINLVRSRHPSWPDSKVKTVAQKEFEKAGKNFMNSTLHLGLKMRSQGLWGYYLYPECYNYNYKNHPHKYTGKCPNIEISRNNQLLWLWKASTALFPSIYLPEILKSSTNVLKFVHHRVREAIRVATVARQDYVLPVFVYSRPFYSYSLIALSQMDLVHTIGESAALGAAGMVMWGNKQYEASRDNCLTVQKYINETLGPYIINVTLATQFCSQELCQKKGRCVRKLPESSTYLHMPSGSIKTKVSKKSSKLTFFFKMTKKEKQDLKKGFVCQYYLGWSGKFCKKQDASSSHLKSGFLAQGWSSPRISQTLLLNWILAEILLTLCYFMIN